MCVDARQPFTFKVDTTKGNGFPSFKMPLISGVHNFTYTVNDGTPVQITSYNQPETLIEFPQHGIYEIKIRGKVGNWYDNNTGDVQKYIEVSKFGTTEFVSIDSMFYGATNLKLISDEGPNAQKSVYCNNFLRASGIEFIPKNLIKRLTSCISLNYHLCQCPNLAGTLPVDYFDNAIKIVNLSYLLYETKVTGDVPSTWLNKLTDLTYCANHLLGCNLLTFQLSPNYFSTNHKLKDLSGLFYSCTGLYGTIPSTFFEHLIELTTLASAFGYCSGLTGAIPEQLLWTLTKLTSLNSFMRSCTGLTTIYTNMLIHNTLLTNVGLMLDSAINVRGTLPTFKNCKLITIYAYTFNSMRLCATPSDLFDLPSISIVTNIVSFARVTSTSYSHTGTLQDFWNYCNPATKTGVFINCTALTNYNDLRLVWPI